MRIEELLTFITKDNLAECNANEDDTSSISGFINGIENIKMPPISCIYIGALCSIENKKKLVRIANELNVPVKQMTVDRGEYTLHTQDCV